jgi:hypothetical protein
LQQQQQQQHIGIIIEADNESKTAELDGLILW